MRPRLPSRLFGMMTARHGENGKTHQHGKVPPDSSEEEEGGGEWPPSSTEIISKMATGTVPPVGLSLIFRLCYKSATSYRGKEYVPSAIPSHPICCARREYVTGSDFRIHTTVCLILHSMEMRVGRPPPPSQDRASLTTTSVKKTTCGDQPRVQGGS
jgi:hypothetical protein